MPMFAWTENAIIWLLNKIKEQSQAPKKYELLQIPVSAWVEEETEDGYRYAAAVPVVGCTADHMPIVTFADDDVEDFYSTCKSGDGTVTVYAEDIPSGSITLQSVVIM